MVLAALYIYFISDWIYLLFHIVVNLLISMLVKLAVLLLVLTVVYSEKDYTDFVKTLKTNI